MMMETGFIMILPVLLGAMIGALVLVWWERRLLGFFQGPGRTEPAWTPSVCCRWLPMPSS